MKGVRREHLWIGILICALIVALPAVFNSLGGGAMLNRAIRNGETRRVKALLDDRPELAHGVDRRTGATPLHLAVIADQAQSVRLLIESGADINTPDREGFTPLHKAASFDRPVIAELLIAEGADIDALAVKYYRAVRMNPMHVAAEAGYRDMVRILLDSGADVNARTEGANEVTSLHMAASRGHFGVVRLLLERGAYVNARDSVGTTPLRWARESGRERIEELIRVYGGRE